MSKGRIKDEKIRRQKQYQEPGGLAQTDYLCQASLLSATSHLLFAQAEIAKISRAKCCQREHRTLQHSCLENGNHSSGGRVRSLEVTALTYREAMAPALGCSKSISGQRHRTKVASVLSAGSLSQSWVSLVSHVANSLL